RGGVLIWDTTGESDRRDPDDNSAAFQSTFVLSSERRPFRARLPVNMPFVADLKGVDFFLSECYPLWRAVNLEIEPRGLFAGRGERDHPSLLAFEAFEIRKVGRGLESRHVPVLFCYSILPEREPGKLPLVVTDAEPFVSVGILQQDLRLSGLIGG